MTLVLSLFPGIGLLDTAFEQEGFCVVRGPDLLWGGDIKTFHPPAGVFDGVIGGPPCQAFSRLQALVAHNRKMNPGKFKKAENLIPEFARCVNEAQPYWFLMENVPRAPAPDVLWYSVTSVLINNRWCEGIQNRVRLFTFGSLHGEAITWPKESPGPAENVPAVMASAGGRETPVKIGGSGKCKPGRDVWCGRGKALEVSELCRRQGLPGDFLDAAPFTVEGKRKAIGNGVPLPMGRAVARAVREALTQ